MKRRLKQIYQDLSDGKLTQKEAIDKIKTLKSQEQGKSMGTLLATPMWEEHKIKTAFNPDHSEFTEHHIMLCELPNVNDKQVEALISKSHCSSFQTSGQRNIAERCSEVGLACFELVKKILKGKPSGKVFIQVVIPNKPEETLFAGLSGLLKTASLENPQITGQIILTMPKISVDELSIRLLADKTRHQDKIVKYENGTRHVLRLKEVQANEATPEIAFKDHGVYLITGGLGGLGVLFAKEIIKQTSKAKIILAGRSELTPDKKKMLESLSAQRNAVEYRQVDIADLDQVNQLIAAIKKENKQLNGIIHCAGITTDNFILKKTSE